MLVFGGIFSLGTGGGGSEIGQSNFVVGTCFQDRFLNFLHSKSQVPFLQLGEFFESFGEIGLNPVLFIESHLLKQLNNNSLNVEQLKQLNIFWNRFPCVTVAPMVLSFRQSSLVSQWRLVDRSEHEIHGVPRHTNVVELYMGVTWGIIPGRT